MALPASAPKVNCTLSKPLMADGTEGAIKSASLKIDRDLVWVASGETIYKDSVPTQVATGDVDVAGTLSFQVIPTDIPGVRDAAGSLVQNWVYTLRVVLTLPNGQERTVDYIFQPRVDQDIDLDLVPRQNVETLPPVTRDVVDGGSL